MRRDYTATRPFRILLLFLFSMVLFSSCVTTPEQMPEEPAEEENVYESVGNCVIVGDIPGAIAAFETLNAENPDDPDTKNAYVKLLFAAGRIDEAEAIITELLANNPLDPGTLFNAALLAGLKGNTEERERRLKQVVEIEPGNADARALLGELFLERKLYEEAEHSFLAALETDPRNLPASSGLAHILRNRGDLTGALEHTSRVVEIEPSFSLGWADRASILQALGNLPGALEDYDRAIELDPRFYWHYIDRAKLFIQCGRLEEALNDLNEAVGIDSEHFYAYILKAGVEDDLDLYQEAVEDYFIVLSKRPDYTYAYENLGILLFIQERWTEAEEAFLKAYPYSRDRYDYILLAAVSRFRSGIDARDFVSEWVNKIPRDDLLYHVGRVFLEGGYASMAIRKIQEEGDSPEATQALFYLAEYFLASGSEHTAFSYFLEIEERNIIGLIETRLAGIELSKISDIH